MMATTPSLFQEIVLGDRFRDPVAVIKPGVFDFLAVDPSLIVDVLHRFFHSDGVVFPDIRCGSCRVHNTPHRDIGQPLQKRKKQALDQVQIEMNTLRCIFFMSFPPFKID
jgi:hypothetical protein